MIPNSPSSYAQRQRYASAHVYRSSHNPNKSDYSLRGLRFSDGPERQPFGLTLRTEQPGDRVSSTPPHGTDHSQRVPAQSGLARLAESIEGPHVRLEGRYRRVCRAMCHDLHPQHSSSRYDSLVHSAALKTSNIQTDRPPCKPGPPRIQRATRPPAFAQGPGSPQLSMASMAARIAADMDARTAAARTTHQVLKPCIKPSPPDTTNSSQEVPDSQSMAHAFGVIASLEQAFAQLLEAPALPAYKEGLVKILGALEHVPSFGVLEIQNSRKRLEDLVKAALKRSRHVSFILPAGNERITIADITPTRETPKPSNPARHKPSAVEIASILAHIAKGEEHFERLMDQSTKLGPYAFKRALWHMHSMLKSIRSAGVADVRRMRNDLHRRVFEAYTTFQRVLRELRELQVGTEGEAVDITRICMSPRFVTCSTVAGAANSSQSNIFERDTMSNEFEQLAAALVRARVTSERSGSRWSPYPRPPTPFPRHTTLSDAELDSAGLACHCATNPPAITQDDNPVHVVPTLTIIPPDDEAPRPHGEQDVMDVCTDAPASEHGQLDLLAPPPDTRATQRFQFVQVNPLEIVAGLRQPNPERVVDVVHSSPAPLPSEARETDWADVSEDDKSETDSIVFIL